MELPVVINPRIRDVPRGALYITSHRWRCPFKLGTHAQTRAEIVQLYRRYLWRQIRNGTITRDNLLALQGIVLVCYCKPRPCHGDVIVQAVKWAIENP